MTKILPVQTEALRRSKGRRGFAFFMEQGLGKTFTSLLDFVEHDCDCMVVLCPNSFKSGWIAEIHKHGFDVDWLIYESGNSAVNSRFASRRGGRKAVLVINYEAIRGDEAQNTILKFIQDRRCAIYADESIQISTHDSSQTKAAISLAKEFTYRRILSGKPMKQGPHDYWSQLRFIGELDGKNFFAFRNTFCIMGGFKAKQVRSIKNEDLLAEILDPVSFTARKSEWAKELPPKLWTTREYQLTPTMQCQFDEMMEDFCVFVGDGDVVAVDAAITKYMKLAQIQTGFIYDAEGNIIDLVGGGKNPRVELLLDIIENEVSGKVAIPYTHKPVFDILSKSLAKYNIAHIKGGMSPAEIDEQKAKFNDDPACRAIILQTVASKYGHTLLGQPGDRCSTMVFFENTYSLDDRSQIEDRVHRHGQDSDKVLYIDLSGTAIDRRMTDALQRKEDIFQTVLKAVQDYRSRRA